jgi:membrane protein insertase Oxa1/YidC/SpoIIIJ
MIAETFLAPIIFVLQKLMALFYGLSNNIGLSLIFLSCSTTIMLTPFVRWAASISRREKDIQAVLVPQIKNISEDSGLKRHKRIAALYKRYSYHPFYAIRERTGLVIELIVLAAAFTMLSDCNLIQGQSFFWIKDVSKPDGLINGINLLPFLMTFINLLAIFTSKDFSVKKNPQSILISLGILVLLYNSSAAIAFFWTIYQLTSLVKNISEYSSKLEV